MLDEVAMDADLARQHGISAVAQANTLSVAMAGNPRQQHEHQQDVQRCKQQGDGWHWRLVEEIAGDEQTSVQPDDRISRHPDGWRGTGAGVAATQTLQKIHAADIDRDMGGV